MNWTYTLAVIGVLAEGVLCSGGSSMQPAQERKDARRSVPDGPASAELRAIAKADQADRQFTKQPTAEAWKPITLRDAERRKRVLTLLNADQLVTADDFDTAALIFQHGETPDDFLAAHELAALGRMLGHIGSLSALAEDRFLTRIGKSQRIGSQFSFNASGQIVLGDIDTGGAYGVTDGLRRDMFVPTPEEWRRDGMKAVETSFPALVARLEERTNRDWLEKAARVPEARELAKLAAQPTLAAVSRVLDLYHADLLATPQDYYNGARVLYAAGDRSSLLAHDLATVALARGSRPARRLFAQTLDAYLVAIGREQRYGTAKQVRGANRAPRSSTLSDAVLMRLGLPPRRPEPSTTWPRTWCAWTGGTTIACYPISCRSLFRYRKRQTRDDDRLQYGTGYSLHRSQDQ